MKKNIITMYLGIPFHDIKGEQYAKIFRYFIPEFITSLALYSLPGWLEAYFIQNCASSPTYAILGTTNTLMHLLIKIAEAFSIGTVILVGYYNGTHAYKQAGKVLYNAFWITCCIGLCAALFLFFGARFIYGWYGVSEELITYGVPFLRIRAIGVFFTFIYFSCIGFLRGVKNTRTPMLFFIWGTLLLIVCNYIFIFGIYKLPSYGLLGIAWATTIQYGSMALCALMYIVIHKNYRKYDIQVLHTTVEHSYIRDLIQMSWPIIIDKAMLAIAYMWLCKMIAPLGTMALAAFWIIKELERFAFLPAIAFAQIITFLASNNYGAGLWEHIEANIKKVIFIASCFVFSILFMLFFLTDKILLCVDTHKEFSALVQYAFPIISVLVLLDLLQLILAGGLRGAGNVKTVMMIRLLVCLGYFIPISYAISYFLIESVTIKFILLYSAFYIGNGFMTIFYIYRFRSNAWKTKPV